MCSVSTERERARKEEKRRRKEGGREDETEGLSVKQGGRKKAGEMWGEVLSVWVT